jgi:macrolide-specific efflux system membrane fusion protein
MVKPANGDAPVEKPVTTGITDGKKTEILAGLTEGDTVLAAEISTGKARESQGTNPFMPGNMKRGKK